MCERRNRYVNRSGFSAQQRVFESSLRLPGHMLSDDPINRLLIATDPTNEFRRSSELRAASQQALFRSAEDRALRAAAGARPRSPPRRNFREGSVVNVWRDNRQVGARGWVGAGVVVCINPTIASVWVTMRGALLKCCSEPVREATDEEWSGAEVAKLVSREALAHLQQAGHRGFMDTTGEARRPEDGVDTPPAAKDIGGLQALCGGIDPINPRLATIPGGGNLSDATSAVSQPEREPGEMQRESTRRPSPASEDERPAQRPRPSPRGDHGSPAGAGALEDIGVPPMWMQPPPPRDGWAEAAASDALRVWTDGETAELRPVTPWDQASSTTTWTRRVRPPSMPHGSRRCKSCTNWGP